MFGAPPLRCTLLGPTVGPFCFPGLAMAYLSIYASCAFRKRSPRRSNPKRYVTWSEYLPPFSGIQSVSLYLSTDVHRTRMLPEKLYINPYQCTAIVH